MTTLSAVLRILSGLAIVGSIAYAGYVHRSPWVIPIFGLVFTALYITGKARQWRRIWREHGIPAILGNLAVTLPVQIVMAAFFFFCGYGVGAVVHDTPIQAEVAKFDLVLAGVLLAVGLSVGFFINWLERGTPDPDTIDLETAEILQAVLELEGKSTCMPIEIFGLSRRLADLEDRSVAFDLMEPQMFESRNAFVRRASMTAIRFMGQPARSEYAEIVDRRIVEGLGDSNPWVRYDSAWAAGEIVGEADLFETALNRAVDELNRSPEAKIESSAEQQALERAIQSLKEISERRERLH